MALDHVRDYFHYTAFTDSPTNLMTTTPLLFFTRWITHLCAPAFLLLSGISAYLSGQKKTKGELSLFLIKRGCWLILVELFIVTLAWTFDPLYHVFILQVIWAIGVSMIILGMLVWLPVNTILVCGLLIIFFHNLLDIPERSSDTHIGLLWNLAHHGNFTPIHLWPGHIALIVYAFLPWTGIMLLGYGLGRIFNTRFDSSRRKILLLSGSALILIFIIFRSYNHYGDPEHWRLIRNHFYSWLSYINVSKYPPSLDYISITIGIAFILLALLDRSSKNSFSFARVFGRVPFFFYVLHLYLIHLLTMILFFVQGYQTKDIRPQHSPFMFRPDNFGFGLAGVYLIWIAVILILYPFCRSYDDYKTTHRKWWLSYV
jgi:uncharacterized membrane protein